MDCVSCWTAPASQRRTVPASQMASSDPSAAADQHHMRDVGKILLAAQNDLRQIREALAGAGGGNVRLTAESLQSVVAKVEADLRLKAEAVLNTVHSNVATLPTLGAYNFSGGDTSNGAGPGQGLPKPRLGPPRVSRSAGDVGLDPVARPAAASLAASRHAVMINNPGSVHSRAHMAARFGVAAPSKHAPMRPLGRDKPGKLLKERVSKPLGAPPSDVRHDPQAIPPIGPRDVAAGLLSLVTRGLLPPNVDLTPALERRPAPMVQAPAKMHEFHSQFATTSSAAYTSPFGFNVSNTKLDLISDVGVTLAEKREREAAAPPVARAQPQPLQLEPTDLGGAELSPPSPKPGDVLDARAREFDELMDTFSLHHFIIRNGLVLDSTPEYASYQRKYASSWGALQQLIDQLSSLMARYSVPLAYVDGQKLASLALDPLAVHDERALLECLVNKDQVGACMSVPGQRYRAGAAGAETAAATELQSVMRGKLARQLASEMRRQEIAADSLTRRAKVYVAMHETERRLGDKAAADAAAWERLVSEFRDDWPRIRGKPRVIIHLASISGTQAQRASMPNLDVRQNCQLPRLCDVKEPGVDVLYVAPFPLNDDVTHYFGKVLEIGGVPEPAKRYKIVVPENHARLPSSLSLTSMLLYSPKALKKILTFCKGKPAYIVPSVIGPEERKLALALNLPLLAPEPGVAALYTTKSGSKRIFASASVNTPPGMHDLYDEQSLLTGLAQLICTHLDVPRWVFKLDDEFGGRGIAHIDVQPLACYQDLLRTHDSDPERWVDEQLQASLQTKLIEALRAELPSKVIINMRWLWRSWRDYTLAFRRVGGVIEASPLQTSSSPSVNLCIDPDGGIRITSVHEQILSSPYTFVGAAFPQTAVPYPALREASLAVAKAAFERGILGHVGIDFVSFFDSDGQLRVWAIDLNVRLTQTAVSFGFFDFLVGGSFDVATGRYAVKPPGPDGAGSGGLQQRSYVMNEMLYHPQLPQTHHSAFFSLCRLKGVSFDLAERTGTVFNLMDSFAGGVIGVLTVGTSLLDSLRKFADCLDFMQKNVGPATGGKPTGLTHETSFRDIIRAIKAIVDAQVGDTKQTPMPPPQPALIRPVERAAAPEAAPPVPAVAGTRLKPLPPPDKRYLKDGVQPLK